VRHGVEMVVAMKREVVGLSLDHIYAAENVTDATVARIFQALKERRLNSIAASNVGHGAY